MVASVLIIVFSVGLFLYWFRYTCLLILSTRSAKDYTRQVAAVNQLSFLEIQSRLNGVSGGAELDSLRASLDHDYRLISYLLRHAADFQIGGGSVEQNMLRIDFKVMSAWYAITSRFSTFHAREALSEMAEIVGHFANTMGERQAASSAA